MAVSTATLSQPVPSLAVILQSVLSLAWHCRWHGTVIGMALSVAWHCQCGPCTLGAHCFIHQSLTVGLHIPSVCVENLISHSFSVLRRKNKTGLITRISCDRFVDLCAHKGLARNKLDLASPS